LKLDCCDAMLASLDGVVVIIYHHWVAFADERRDACGLCCASTGWEVV